MDLNNDRKMLLEKVSKNNKIHPATIYEEDSTVNETFGSERTVRRALKELVNDEGFLEREKDGQRYLYTMTEKGRKYLMKIKKRERQKKDESNLFDYDDGYEEFVDFFESENHGQNQIKKAGIGRNFVYLDYKKLERFNPDLADDLMQDPDRVLEACKEAVRSLPEVQDNVDVRVKNVSDFEEQSINELTARDRNKLVVVEGVIQSVSRPGSQLVSADFECIQCGQTYTKEQDSQQLKSPYKCECGSKQFEPVNERHETVRYLTLKERPDQRSRDKIVTVIQGDLAEDESKNLKAMGSGVKVVGYLDTYMKKKTDEFQSFRLVANNIEVEDSKWELENLSDSEIEEIKELSERSDIPDYLTQSLAFEEIKNNHLLKKSFIVWLLGRSSNFGNVHFLCIGDPGTGKSHLAKYVSENADRVIKSVASGATEVGLTAAVVKDEMTGEWTAEAGSLAMADGGFHITDEIDELDDDHYSAYNEALSDETITLSKAGIHAELGASVSEFALGNPAPHYSFDDMDPKIEQVPIDKDDLISRFGIILAVENDDDTEQYLEKVEHILNRENASGFKEADYISENTLFNYIHYAQQLSPELSDEAYNKIMDACESLFNEGNDRIKLRHAEALATVSVAFARMNLVEEVTAAHVEEAFEFFVDCYKSMDFDIGNDDFTDFDSKNKRQIRKIKEAYELLSDPDDKKVLVDDLVQEVELSESIVEDTLQKLKREGEFFEPNAGEVQKV